MMEMRSEACKRFLEQLDGFMDGSLSGEELSFMQAHAAECESCAEQMKLVGEMKKYIAGLDDEVAVPLAAQNAWRQAVRREARAQKRSLLMRWAAGIAAALVAVLGSAALLGGSDFVDQAVEDAEALTYRKIAMPHSEVYSFDSAEGADWVFYEADGGETAKVVDTKDDANESTMLKTRAFSTQESEKEPADLFDEMPVENDSATWTGKQSSSPMLVRSASVKGGTDDFERGCQNLRALVEEYSGYFASETVEPTGYGDQHVSRSAIRVPMELMDEFLTALQNIADIQSVEIRNENVDEYYYDAESRLDSQQLIIERLKMLIANASGEEMLTLNSQLEQAYSRVDELERVLRAYQTDVRFATVELELYEVNAHFGIPGANMAPQTTKEPTLSERSSSGFKQSLEKIGSFFESMIVSLAVIAPVILIVAAVSGLVGGAIWCTKHKKERLENEKSEKE